MSRRVKFDDCNSVASSREQSKLSSNGIRVVRSCKQWNILKRQKITKLGIEGVKTHSQINRTHGIEVITTQKTTDLNQKILRCQLKLCFLIFN